MSKEVTKITLINQPNINPQLLGVTICCFHHFQMQIKAFLLYMAIVRIMDTPIASNEKSQQLHRKIKIQARVKVF